MCFSLYYIQSLIVIYCIVLHWTNIKHSARKSNKHWMFKWNEFLFFSILNWACVRMSYVETQNNGRTMKTASYAILKWTKLYNLDLSWNFVQFKHVCKNDNRTRGFPGQLLNPKKIKICLRRLYSKKKKAIVHWMDSIRIHV